MGRARQTVRSLGAALIEPSYRPAGHFYSPVPSADDVDRALKIDGGEWAGVDIGEADQVALARELLSTMRSFAGDRWRPNGMFGRADASTYRAVLEHVRPSSIVEVGSGFSTAVVLDYHDVHGPVDLTCVEPYPERLREVVRDGDPVTLIQSPVQDVDPGLLADTDLLFIDSTHVGKAGSDVTYLLFKVLPRARPGTWVHVHDVFWPHGYPAKWLQQRRGWNESYLLRAFLMYNDTWQVRLFGSWLSEHLPEFSAVLPQHARPGSVWIERVN
jgi:hypothetical protein